ncbi:hypothetical protein [Acidisoma sp. L85]|uniref:hypothetical protein n=1 Tax=Acidisoma sp. L85 TaxID=1641850 RepID=UPI00131A6EFF|nr:hypothetical protein [Acidisoma sp. L85]
MLADLLAYDLTGFEVRNVPNTEGLQEQRKLSQKTHELWWVDVLSRGYVTAGCGEAWQGWVATSTLFNDYLSFAKDRDERDKLARETFGRFIVKMGGKSKRMPASERDSNSHPLPIEGEGTRPPGYAWSSLEDARTICEEVTGLTYDWPVLDEDEPTTANGEPDNANDETETPPAPADNVYDFTVAKDRANAA